MSIVAARFIGVMPIVASVMMKSVELEFCLFSDEKGMFKDDGIDGIFSPSLNWRKFRQALFRETCGHEMSGLPVGHKSVKSRT